MNVQRLKQELKFDYSDSLQEQSAILEAASHIQLNVKNEIGSKHLPSLKNQLAFENNSSREMQTDVNQSGLCYYFYYHNEELRGCGIHVH